MQNFVKVKGTIFRIGDVWTLKFFCMNRSVICDIDKYSLEFFHAKAKLQMSQIQLCEGFVTMQTHYYFDFTYDIMFSVSVNSKTSFD